MNSSRIALWRFFKALPLTPQRAYSTLTEQLQNLKQADPHRLQSFGELIRSIFVLQLSSWAAFAKNVDKLYTVAGKLVGQRGANALSWVFYKHFVAGKADADLARASSRLLSQGNVRLMLCPPMEDLEGASENYMSMANRAKNQFLKYLEVAHQLNKEQQGQSSVVQLKPTAIFPAEALNVASENYLQQKVPFRDTTMNYVEALKGKISLVKDGSIIDQAIDYGIRSWTEILEKGKELDIPILVDAEWSSSYYVYCAINVAAMIVYNRPKHHNTLVYGTYQCYLKDVHDYVAESQAVCVENGGRFAPKFVRGAYMELERLLAATNNMPDPIYPNYEAANASYDKAVANILTQYHKNPDYFGLFVATHNLKSVQRAVELMNKLDIPPNDSRINFGQIYGMCDRLSYALGMAGYNVYKSTPWGPAEEWMPYLSRRAAENHVAFQSARNELPACRAELKRRLSFAK